MKKLFPLWALLNLFYCPTLDAQSYPKDYFGNPVDSPFVLAGTFGEIRNNHFHTGIDFSTRNEEGRPVYAAAGGYVSRLKVSSGGFGKAIYVTHPNGYVTVYGHLKKFSPELAKYCSKQQHKLESFEIDIAIEPGKLKVGKGEQIAWSGNSGSSTGPHLHFEIRDAATEEPINPLLFGFTVPDTVKPVIKTIRIHPVVSQGVVVDSDQPKTYEVNSSASGLRLASKDYIQVFGKIGFEFELNDFIQGSASALGIYSMQLTVDTQQIFSMTYDRLNFNDLRYVNAHIDYAAQYDDEGTFERCFRLPGDHLKIYSTQGTDGYFEFLADGVHDVNLTVKDFAGNAAVLAFQVISYSSLARSQYRLPPETYFPMIPDKGLAIHKSDVEIIIPANTIYETLLFTNSVSERKPGYYSSTYEVGDPHVPLHQAITVAIRPKNLPDELKPKAVLVSFDKRGKTVYEGNAWNKEFISAKPKHFGSFAVAVDSIPPVIRLVNLPTDKNPEGALLRISVSDDLSGITSYRATLNGKWFLMEYDAKNNLLTGAFEDQKKGASANLTLTVTDAVGNVSTFTKEIVY